MKTVNELQVTLRISRRDDGSVFITCNEVPFVNVVGSCEAEALDLAFDMLRGTLQANHACKVVGMRKAAQDDLVMPTALEYVLTYVSGGAGSYDWRQALGTDKVGQ